MPLELIQGNALLLEIPKTGGTFVRNVLTALDIKTREVTNTAAHKHALPRHIPGLHTYTVRFCFVRHPLEWYRSVWRFDVNYPRKPDNHARNLAAWQKYPWHPHTPLTRHITDSFADTVRAWIKHEPAYCTRLFEQYVGMGHNDCFVGTAEQLAEHLGDVLRRLGFDASQERIDAVPRANESPGPPLPEWPDDLWAEVLRLEAPIITRFYGNDA